MTDMNEAMKMFEDTCSPCLKTGTCEETDTITIPGVSTMTCNAAAAMYNSLKSATPVTTLDAKKHHLNSMEHSHCAGGNLGWGKKCWTENNKGTCIDDCHNKR